MSNLMTNLLYFCICLCFFFQNLADSTVVLEIKKSTDEETPTEVVLQGKETEMWHKSYCENINTGSDLMSATCSHKSYKNSGL